MPFDPSQPFEIEKESSGGSFDPSQPFTIVEEPPSISSRAILPAPGAAPPKTGTPPPDVTQAFPAEEQKASEGMALGESQRKRTEEIASGQTKSLSALQAEVTGIAQPESEIQPIGKEGTILRGASTVAAAVLNRPEYLAALANPATATAVGSYFVPGVAKQFLTDLGDAIKGDNEALGRAAAIGIPALIGGVKTGKTITERLAAQTQLERMQAASNAAHIDAVARERLSPNNARFEANRLPSPKPPADLILPEAANELSKFPGGANAIQERGAETLPLENKPEAGAEVGARVAGPETPAVPQNVSEQQPQPPAQGGGEVRDVAPSHDAESIKITEDQVPWGERGTMAPGGVEQARIFSQLSNAFGVRRALDMTAGKEPYPSLAEFKENIEEYYSNEGDKMRLSLADKLARVGEGSRTSEIPSRADFDSGLAYYQEMLRVGAEAQKKGLGLAASFAKRDPLKKGTQRKDKAPTAPNLPPTPAGEGGAASPATTTEASPPAVESGGAIPRLPKLPSGKGLSPEEKTAAFQSYSDQLKEYNRQVAAWESARPGNKPILFKRGDSYIAITKDPSGQWRATTFSKAFRDRPELMPWGHELYKTRLDAVKEYIHTGVELADKLPEVLTEAEIKTENARRFAEDKAKADAEAAAKTPKPIPVEPAGVPKRRGVERPPDIIDTIIERIGKIRGKKHAKPGSEGYYSEAYEEAKTGAGRDLFGPEGQSPDEALDTLRREGYFNENADVDDMWNAVNKAKGARRAHFRGETPEAQADKFHAALQKQGKIKSSHVVSVGDLSVGDTFVIGKEKLEVTSIDPDTGEVTVKDGRKFGYQTIPDGADIPVEKGSFKATPKAAEFGKEDFTLNAPESVEQQKARLAQEEAAAKAKADREKIEDEASKALVGSTGDIGQKDMFGGGDLFSEAPLDISKGPGAASPSDVSKPGDVVSNMFAAIDRDRAQLGKPPMEPGEPRTWDEDQNIATAKINRDPGWIPALIKEVLDKPRPLLSWEHAGTVIQKAYWKAELNNALRRMANAFDSDLGAEELARARADAARFEDSIMELEKAVGRGGTGSEAGRTLQAQKMGLNDELTLVEMRLEARGRFGGRPLTEAESAKVDQIHAEYQKKLAAAEKTAAEADKRRIDAETRATLAELAKTQAQAQIPPPHIQKLISRVGQVIHERANAARERLRGKLFTLSPEVIKDLAEIGADNLWTIGEYFGEWSAKMIAEIGEHVKPHLQTIWEASKKLMEDTWKSEAGPKAKRPAKPKEVELAKQTIKKGDSAEQRREKLAARIEKRIEKGELDRVAPAVQMLARTFVEEGIHEREALIDAVHGVLGDIIPDWTRRNTMDAISGYGNFKSLSKDEISVRLRDLKGQMQQIAKLEDMAAGEAPLRSGLERREVTKAQSELIKLVNEAKRKGGYKTTDPTKQLRTALDEVKKRTETLIQDYEKRIVEKDYTVRKPQPIRPDTELQSKQAELRRVRAKWEQQKRDWELSQRKRWQKLLDRAVRWERAFKLSSPVVFGKLAGAAMTRFVETAASESVGGVMGVIPGIRTVAKQAPREGGFSARGLARGYVAAFRQGMKDAWDTVKKGAADIDVLYGDKIADKDWANLFGQLHGMMKAPVKRAEFELALEKRTQHAIRNGLDPSDPLVQAGLFSEALNDGYRAIFMQRGFSSDMFNQLVSQMEKSKKYPVAGEISARVARFLLPVVRVPTNIVAETTTGIIGAPVASARTMIHAVNGTLNKLDAKTADSIMRQFKKGSIGLGLIAIGFFNPQSVGGFDWKEKRKPGEVKAAGFQIGGTDIPRWMTHAPWFELMQFGATIRRVKEHHVAKTGAEKGLDEGLWAAGLGLVEETPFVGQMLRVDKIFQSPSERTYYLGELAKSTLLPQAVIKAADIMDDGTKRKPETIMEHVKMGVPGLRETVAKKPEPKPPKPSRRSLPKVTQMAP